MKKVYQNPETPFWRLFAALIFITGLVILAWLLFNPTRVLAKSSGEIPVALHSSSMADYSVDQMPYKIPAVSMNLVEEVLQDHQDWAESHQNELLSESESHLVVIRPTTVLPLEATPRPTFTSTAILTPLQTMPVTMAVSPVHMTETVENTPEPVVSATLVSDPTGKNKPLKGTPEPKKNKTPKEHPEKKSHKIK